MFYFKRLEKAPSDTFCKLTIEAQYKSSLPGGLLADALPTAGLCLRRCAGATVGASAPLTSQMICYDKCHCHNWLTVGQFDYKGRLRDLIHDWHQIILST